MSDFENSVREGQAKLEAMREELWPRFAEFRDGFIEELTPFARSGFDSGGRESRIPRIDAGDGDWQQMHVTIHGHDLRVEYPTKSTANALRFDYPTQTGEKTDTGRYAGAPPAFPIVIHLDIEEGSHVYGAVQAGYRGEKGYDYHILQLLGNGTIRHLGGGPSLSRETGRQAATKLIRHFYALKSK